MDRPDWYRRTEVTRWLAFGYYQALRRICHGHPELRRLRRRCGRCGVRLLTGRSNSGLSYISCAFGCREKRKREKTNERGRRHYLTPKGRQNKKARNRRRSLASARPSKNKRSTAGKERPTFFRPDMLRYIAFLLRLASGQKPPLREVEKFLKAVLVAVVEGAQSAILRQRSWSSLPEPDG